MPGKIGFSSSGIFLMPVKPATLAGEEIQKIVNDGISRCAIKIKDGLPITPEFVWVGGLEDPALKVTIDGTVYQSTPTIYLARIEPFGVNDPPIPEWINQELSLAHAEVWINVLQMIKGGPVAQEVPDSKLDAQIYLMDSGVKVTSRFSRGEEKYNPLNNPNEQGLRDFQNRIDQNPNK